MSQYDNQLEILLSRETKIRVMKQLPESKVVEIRMNPTTMAAEKITAAQSLEKELEKIEVDKMWLEETEKMIEEEMTVAITNN